MRILMKKMMFCRQIHVVRLEDQRNAEFVVPLSQRNIQSDCKDAVGVKKQDIQGEHVENPFRKTIKWERTGRNAGQTIVLWKEESIIISVRWNNARANTTDGKVNRIKIFSSSVSVYR